MQAKKNPNPSSVAGTLARWIIKTIIFWIRISASSQLLSYRASAILELLEKIENPTIWKFQPQHSVPNTHVIEQLIPEISIHADISHEAEWIHAVLKFDYWIPFGKQQKGEYANHHWTKQKVDEKENRKRRPGFISQVQGAIV